MILKTGLKYFHIICLLSGGMLLSCSESELMTELPLNHVALRVAAEIQGAKNTRTYQSSGVINEGTYYMSYINNQGGSQISEVVFVNGSGHISIDNDKYLEWDQIGYNSGSETTSQFFLDNVPPEKGGKIVNFTEEYNPFVAGVLDINDGSNDLLWGERQIARNSPIVNFQLHHCMAMINVELTYEKNIEGITENLNIEGATVSISNLLQTPKSYNRETGELSFTKIEANEEASGNPETNQPDLSEFKSMTLVDTYFPWKSPEQSEKDGKEITIYKSKDFVLPPQELLTTDERPRLSVKIPKGDGEEITYSGVIPRAMDMTMSDGSKVPMTLSLLREYCLTLHIRLSLDPVEIIFMPVTVADWVDKGTILINADQAGINDEPGFLKFINVLKEYTPGQEDKLERFGYKDDKDGEKWKFNIFSELSFDLNDENQELKLEDIKGVLRDVDLPAFSFNMHNWKIYIYSEGQEYVLTTSEELYNFLVNGQ